ncbi:MAG: acyltransferase [Pelagibacteraceae bacterium]|nr:acyltransferase [Pelagibacteraceae bacterium]|tara:strand:+ start:652 stop:1494 length:843 start_codon:yes stop_codon:yes gene_type:complete
MEKIKTKKIAFTFASSEVNLIGQNFIKFVELLTGKLKLKKLYDQYLEEQNPPENFWQDALDKLEFKLIAKYHNNSKIPKKGRLIVVANHAFGVADGVSICSIIAKIRQDYKIITHKVLSQAEAVKDKIIPIDFSQTRDSIISNINARKEAEKFLHNDGVIVIFPSGQIATKENLKFKTKAHDGKWKQFVSKLIIKTKSPVLPLFVEGQNSYLYHIANKMGQTFRYSLLMYELTRKIGDTIKLHIDSVIPFTELKKIDDLKAITSFIRKKTYSLDPEINSN